MASDCKVKDLPTLKREIRALLISSKHGCTPRQLQNDYLQMLGESIPYHFLGFSNFMDFIQSMPDVVSICRTRNNVTLYGVADSKTANIQKLVSKQRSRPGTCSSSHVHLNMVTKNYQPEPKEPEVPPIFKIRLKELMLSHPNGIALKSFNEAFAKRFHHYIAYHHWGFSSLEAMILSVPDILLICNDTTRNIKMVKRVIPQGRASAKKENPGENQIDRRGHFHLFHSKNWLIIGGKEKNSSINWCSLQKAHEITNSDVVQNSTAATSE